MYELSSSLRCVIKPGACANITTLETVRLLKDYGAVLGLRRRYASKGLLLGATLVEDGFVGKLNIQLVNMSDQEIEIAKGEKLLNLLPFEIPEMVCCVSLEDS